MLKALFPNRFPTARSNAPNRTAATAVTSSGKEVVMATNDVPINVAPAPRSVQELAVDDRRYGEQ